MYDDLYITASNSDFGMRDNDTFHIDISDPKRNTHFSKVVCDRRKGVNQLIGESDDIVVIYDIDANEDSIYGKWEQDRYKECTDALLVLKKWKSVKGSHPAMGTIRGCLSKKMSEIRSGNMSCMSEQLDITDDD